VAGALVNMYGKCGQLGAARRLFDAQQVRNAVTWTAMVAAYAQNGHGAQALELFHVMNAEGVGACSVVFVSILSACSHLGLVRQARDYVHSITRDHGMAVTWDHYHCMIDVFGRAGWLLEAEELITSMPFLPGDVAWTTLLSACKLHGDKHRGNRAADVVIEQEDSDQVGSAFMLLRNVVTD
ncbi:hypothetical protein SELMODRAFT_72308, partial [Selaginella moellendorffii]